MLQIQQVVVFGLMVGLAQGFPRPDSPPIYGPPTYPNPQPHKQPYKDEPAKPYAFDYGVRDAYYGANFGHKENSDGNAITGSYQVALPDGRIQTVNYVADHINGFQAQVSYEGEAVYPQVKKGSNPKGDYQSAAYSNPVPLRAEPPNHPVYSSSSSSSAGSSRAHPSPASPYLPPNSQLLSPPVYD
ncbi:cuticle protein 21-like [Eriocheir sinensis]|uniref:cuticle protein 21-like n=1 Tax=Eriocheir sinensis TaxID=95602 RepID=UPI0021C99E26|nr:cuticle protein 21-like [Eriocheir sinensis]